MGDVCVSKYLPLSFIYLNPASILIVTRNTLLSVINDCAFVSLPTNHLFFYLSCSFYHLCAYQHLYRTSRVLSSFQEVTHTL